MTPLAVALAGVVALAMLAAATLTAGPLGPPAAAAEAAEAAEARGCAGADATPAETTARKLGRAVMCLVNQRRARSDRNRLSPNRDLARVARKHTRVMFAQNCRQDPCRGEKPLQRRILNSGYLDAGGRYGYGESIGCSTTPRVMVRTWLGRRAQRKILLGRRYRDVGIGPAKGAPPVFDRCSEGAPTATYTLLLAWRSRQG